jgi:hypothetical protein
MEYPKISTMTLVATLKNECDVENLFLKLPIDNEVISLKFNKKKPINTCDEISENERFLLTTLSEICKSSGSLDIQMKSASVTVYKNHAKIFGCKSLEEAEETFKKINLEITEIQEKLVIYKYKLTVKFENIKDYPDFIFDGSVLKYKTTKFRFFGKNTIHQMSRSIKEAQEAYDALIREI